MDVPLHPMPEKKPIFKDFNRYHEYYKRKGGYTFMWKNLGKLVIALAILGVIAWLFDRYVFSISDGMEYLKGNFPHSVVFLLFFASEMTLGLIPPESLILWVQGFSYPCLWVFFLACISYLGGVIAYFIGTRLYLMPKIHRWVDETFKVQFEQIRRFGGLLLILATLTPLPYPPSCIVAGMIHFDRRTFLILTLTRFLRFFLYGAVIFAAI